MKKNEMLNKLLELVEQFSKEEQENLVEQIMEMIQETNLDKKDSCHDLVTRGSSGKPDCPRCGAKAAFGDIIKKGPKPNGAQRYKCKSCNRTFQATTGTAFAYAKKDADTWRKYISLTIQGATLLMCEEECDISHQTAQDWRHKILHVFEVNMGTTMLSGNVEVDEMLMPISYKGNHVQGDFGARKKTDDAVNDMPREAYDRGSDNKSMSSKEKACVFCMVQDGNKAFYAAVPGVGFMNEPMLEATVAKHVDKEKTMMLADNYKITQKYFEQNGYAHTILLSNTSDNPKDHKPEIKDGLHLQHVNAMHRHIRAFLAPYCGVSTKYLPGYIALYIWIKTVSMKHRRNQKEKLEEISLSRVSMPDCFVSRESIRNRPAVPCCA